MRYQKYRVEHAHARASARLAVYAPIQSYIQLYTYSRMIYLNVQKPFMGPSERRGERKRSYPHKNQQGFSNVYTYIYITF